jgi:ABC-type molybdate transport system permease subunit
MKNEKMSVKELTTVLCLLPVTFGLALLNTMLCQHVLMKIGVDLTFWNTFFALILARCLLGMPNRVDTNKRNLDFVCRAIGAQVWTLIAALICYWIIF